MTGNQFFNNSLCENKLQYYMAWIFFILANSFIGIILFVNPLKFEFNDNVVQFILFMSGFFIVSILSRFICFGKKNEDNNYLQY